MYCDACYGGNSGAALWTPALTFKSGGLWGPETTAETPSRVDEEFDTDRAPDLIEPILAWRGWDVTPTGHLTASAVSGVWDPGANQAICRHASHTEDVPAVGCGCGFYAWHEPEDIQHGQVRGAIKCWGEIIVHDVGVRAEYAEIICLFASTTHEAWVKRAAERYGVPIVKDQAEAEALAGVEGIRVPEEMRPEKPEGQSVDSFQRAMINVSVALNGQPLGGTWTPYERASAPKAEPPVKPQPSNRLRAWVGLSLFAAYLAQISFFLLPLPLQLGAVGFPITAAYWLMPYWWRLGRKLRCCHHFSHRGLWHNPPAGVKRGNGWADEFSVDLKHGEHCGYCWGKGR